MNKKGWGLLLIVVIVVAGVWWISKGAPSTTSDGPIKVGVIAPLTGDFGIFGERIRNGMELAKADAGYGEELEIIYEDVCLPDDAVSVVRKLINVDQVSWIGGSFCLIGYVPIIPIAEENQVISFNIAANPDVTLNHPYVFSTNKSIRADAQALADYATNEMGAETAAMIYYVTPLGEDYGRYFKQYFEENGGSIVAEQRTDLGETDFRTDLTKISSLNPDVLFVVHLAKPLGTLLKQARELGLESQILSHSEAEDPNVLQIAGEAAEGFVISSSDPEATEVVTDFQERYEAAYDAAPDVIAANAYDALRIQLQAYEKCGQDTDCMRNEFYTTVNYSGVSGNITIEEDGSASKPATFKIVEDGEFVEIEN